MVSHRLIAVIAMCATACGSPSGVGAKPTESARTSADSDGAFAMRVPRAAHAAVALDDGRVLLIGGCVRESCEAGPDSATVDEFDAATRRFKVAGQLHEPRVGTTVARLPGGRVLIAGGWVGSSVTASTEILDSTSGRSVAGPSLSSPKADMAIATLRDGRILLAGGYDGRGSVGEIEIFDPKDHSMRRVGALSEARAGAGAARLPDGRVLVIGGGVNGPSGLRASPTAEIIDWASGKSCRTGSLAEARYKHAVVTLKDGRVLTLGGSDERDSRGKRDTIEAYDAATGRFRPAGRMLAKRYKIANATASLPDGRLVIAGGGPRAEIYDPAAGNSAAVGPDFGGSLNFASATPLASGGVLLAGGYYEDGIRMSSRAWVIR